MPEPLLRRVAFWMLIVFIPAALIGGLIHFHKSDSGLGPILILIGMIGAMVGFIVLKIAGPPESERE